MTDIFPLLGCAALFSLPEPDPRLGSEIRSRRNDASAQGDPYRHGRIRPSNNAIIQSCVACLSLPKTASSRLAVRSESEHEHEHGTVLAALITRTCFAIDRHAAPVCWGILHLCFI